MATVEFHALNISATPHPRGAYRKLFEGLAGKRVKYYGEKIAAFSKPSDTKDGVFWGYIFSWTEIDKNQPVIDTILLQKPDEEKLADIIIPENIGFNWQSFIYVFVEERHLLVFESRNAESRTLAPSNAEKIFRTIFQTNSIVYVLIDGYPLYHVEVDLVVEKNTLDKIFSIPRISQLEIQIGRPNPDDNSIDADRIIERLERINARAEIIRYRVSDSKEGLKPDETMREQGAAALRHGFVEAKGENEGGQIILSSKQYPKSHKAYADPHSTTIDTAIQIAKRIFARLDST
ncbi:DUF4747 family protein [Methylobacterium oryzisoli]|uniref:DUF4747 family protein n=1 Tax=Methylobacterium oryzisoli TaxID=3385502 RepID=UPI003892486A